MAANLRDAGQKLLAWNRTPAKRDPVVEAGAEAAASVEEILDRCATVILMLAGPDATGAILGRGSDAFTRTVCGKLIVNTGTAPPAWSACLAAQVAEAGRRSEEHTSELQSLMRISYAVFCLKTKQTQQTRHTTTLIS